MMYGSVSDVLCFMYALSLLGEPLGRAWDRLGTRRYISPMSCKGLVKVLSRSCEENGKFCLNEWRVLPSYFEFSHILMYEKSKSIAKIKCRIDGLGGTIGLRFSRLGSPPEVKSISDLTRLR